MHIEINRVNKDMLFQTVHVETVVGLQRKDI